MADIKRTLYLARHAKSSWKDSSLSDFERPLNKRGKNDAPAMGEILKERNVKPDLIISSPAKRAKKTACIIGEKIGYPEDKIVFNKDIYEASSRELLSIIHNLNGNINSVMLFGHNPAFTMLNNILGDKYIDNIPTCGVVALQFEKSWNELNEKSGKLLFFEYPKLHK